MSKSNERYVLEVASGYCRRCGGDKREPQSFSPCRLCGGDGHRWAPLLNSIGGPVLRDTEATAGADAATACPGGLWRVTTVPECPVCLTAGCTSCHGDGYKLVAEELEAAADR